jgi:hypothetical protein
MILAEMGVSTSTVLKPEEINTWLKNPVAVLIKFEDDLHKIVDAILHAPHTPRRQPKAA